MGDADDSSDQMGWQHRMVNDATDAEDKPDSLTLREESALDGEDIISSSLVADFDGLSRPGTSSVRFVSYSRPIKTHLTLLGIGTRARLEESSEKAAERLDKLSSAVRTMLECVGEDPARLGLLDTPERCAKALMFLTQGYGANLSDIVNGAIFHENHNEMVIVKDIEIFSMCEHHMLPFIGKMHIGYLPYHSVIGLSKLARIAEMFSRRFQIQERLTKEVANTLMEVLKPQGVAVVMESSHLCMVMRGVGKSTATTITSCMVGCFEVEKMRNEFLSLLGLNK